MTTTIQVIFYSMYGHIYKMTEAIAEGARAVKDVTVQVFRVPELVPEEILEKSGAKAAQQAYAHVPIIKPEQLTDAHAYIFGTPTRFGNMCSQMRNFIDQLGGMWAKDLFVGKIGSVYTSTATQHGGQETTITSFHTTLLHLGMMIVGVPYSEKRLLTMDEISGGTPYGASSLAGGLAGVIIGICIAYFIALVWHWQFVLFWQPPFIGFTVSVLVGIFFGFYPAYKASCLNPIEALRSE